MRKQRIWIFDRRRKLSYAIQKSFSACSSHHNNSKILRLRPIQPASKLIIYPANSTVLLYTATKLDLWSSAVENVIQLVSSNRIANFSGKFFYVVKCALFAVHTKNSDWLEKRAEKVLSKQVYSSLCWMGAELNTWYGFSGDRDLDYQKPFQLDWFRISFELFGWDQTNKAKMSRKVLSVTFVHYDRIRIRFDSVGE